MNGFREIVSIILFTVGIALSLEIIFEGFGWVYIAGALICFFLAYAFWPSKKRGQRQDDNTVLDWLELIIELPIEIFLWMFRLLARIIKHKGADFDLDL